MAGDLWPVVFMIERSEAPLMAAWVARPARKLWPSCMRSAGSLGSRIGHDDRFDIGNGRFAGRR